MNLINGIIIGVASNAVYAFLGWLIKSWIKNQPIAASQPGKQFRSLSYVVDYYVRQEQKRTRPLAPNVVERQTTVVREQRSQSDDDGFGILIIALIVIGALSAFWNSYKVYILVATGFGSIVGWTSSFYFLAILVKIRGPLRWEDYTLTWGSMVVWTLSIIGLTLGVYLPAYPTEISQSSLLLSTAEAFQVIGAAFLFIAIVITAVVQFFAGSIYRKAIADKLPNWAEVWVWSKRKSAIVIAGLALFLGVPMASGLFAYLFVITQVSVTAF